LTDACRATEDVLVEQPTGSGKTVQIVTLIAMHLGRLWCVNRGLAKKCTLARREMSRRARSLIFLLSIAQPPRHNRDVSQKEIKSSLVKLGGQLSALNTSEAATNLLARA
jgi:hypothetical protein